MGTEVANVTRDSDTTAGGQGHIIYITLFHQLNGSIKIYKKVH